MRGPGQAARDRHPDGRLRAALRLDHREQLVGAGERRGRVVGVRAALARGRGHDRLGDRGHGLDDQRALGAPLLVGGELAGAAVARGRRRAPGAVERLGRPAVAPAGRDQRGPEPGLELWGQVRLQIRRGQVRDDAAIDRVAARAAARGSGAGGAGGSTSAAGAAALAGRGPGAWPGLGGAPGRGARRRRPVALAAGGERERGERGERGQRGERGGPRTHGGPPTLTRSRGVEDPVVPIRGRTPSGRGPRQKRRVRSRFWNCFPGVRVFARTRGP